MRYNARTLPGPRVVFARAALSLRHCWRSVSVRVHLVNPSDTSFGLAVITPRWLFVLAAATPERFGTPVLVDETLAQFDATTVMPGDVVGIGIHTGNALRGYVIGHAARARG